MSLVSLGAEDTITRYPSALSDFRDCLSRQEPLIKGEQCQYVHIKT